MRRYLGRIFGITPLLCCLVTSPLRGDPPASVTYSYDDLGRLRTGQYTGGATDGRRVDYQYDPAGNRTTMTSGMPAQLSIGAATAVNEGGTLSFPVTRTGPSVQSITVDCVPQNDSAMGGGVAPFDDFVTTTRQLTFSASDPSPTTKFCDIATKTDSYYEGAQVVAATLQNATAGATIVQPGLARGTINETTAPPSFSVSGNSITEGSVATFTISKAGLTELTHTVSYATADGSATVADGDYTSVGLSTASFTKDQTQVTVTVSTTNDTKFEGAETLRLDLSSAGNGATIATAAAMSTLNNDDAGPTIVIGDAFGNEGTSLTFTARNIGNTSTAFSHSISWTTADNTAAAGSDYAASSGTVSFGPGETTKTISVAALTDGVFEGTSETFFVNLTTNAGTSGAVINDSQGIGTIADLDNPIPSVPPTPLVTSAPLNTSPNFSVIWTASSGPVSYYQLEEQPGGAIYRVDAPTTSRSFTNKSRGEYAYRVRACSAANLCSAYSDPPATKTVCIGPCD